MTAIEENPEIGEIVTVLPLWENCRWSNVPNAELIFSYHVLLFRISSPTFVAGLDFRIGHLQIESTPMRLPMSKWVLVNLVLDPGFFVRGQVSP